MTRRRRRNDRSRTENPQDPDVPVLRIEHNTVQYDDFEEAVKRLCYVENAFPSVEEARAATTEIVFRIKGLEMDDENTRVYTIASNLFTEFNEITGDKRTGLHSTMDGILKKYDYYIPDAPPGTPLSTKKEIFTYLIKNHRYARRNFSDHGTFLCNQLIIDLVVKILFNKRGGPMRLRPRPATIPRQLIALISIMIYHRMTKVAKVSATSDQKNPCTLEAGGSQFGNGSSWDFAYKDMLNPRGAVGRKIKWSQVETFVTAGVVNATGQYDSNDESSESPSPQEHGQSPCPDRSHSRRRGRSYSRSPRRDVLPTPHYGRSRSPYGRSLSSRYRHSRSPDRSRSYSMHSDRSPSPNHGH
ncbi:hypothetical protein BJV82DRAFT_674964 [Fennellomyces sp. T-0311]|nr:hypothetical protein BJV82DRAFT_674964 [Fennellomyces sp. T-0311]